LATQVNLEGIACTIEKLPSGIIRVVHPQPQINAMHGLDTGGAHSFDVYPCQRHQYDFWNGQLPPQERAMPPGAAMQERPWWSSGAGERATLRE